MKWNQHINNTTSAANKTSQTKSKSEIIKGKAFIEVVWPKLEYCKKSLRSLSNKHRKADKWVTNRSHNTSSI